MSDTRHPAQHSPAHEGPAGAAEAHWRAAWSCALQAVELDVDAAEDLMRRLHLGDDDDVPADTAARPWVAPALLGPVPAEFEDRARALLQRQIEVGERLAEAVVTTRAQRRALTKLEQAERPPVFVDTAL